MRDIKNPHRRAFCVIVARICQGRLWAIRDHDRNPWNSSKFFMPIWRGFEPEIRRVRTQALLSTYTNRSCVCVHNNHYMKFSINQKILFESTLNNSRKCSKEWRVKYQLIESSIYWKCVPTCKNTKAFAVRTELGLLQFFHERWILLRIENMINPEYAGLVIFNKLESETTNDVSS